MKQKIAWILRILMGCSIGVFIGTALYRYLDYRTHPMIYASWSAPWHTTLILPGLLTAVVLITSAAALLILKKSGGHKKT